MSEVNKKPQVIRDLLELATYIAEDNLDISDRFLAAAEEHLSSYLNCQRWGKLAGLLIPSWLMFDNKLSKDSKTILSSTA